MRLVVFFALLLAAVSPAALAAGTDADIRVISERNGEIVVEVVPSPRERSPHPVARFYLAIPPKGSVSAERIGGAFAARPIRPAETAQFEIYEKNMGVPPPPGLFPSSPVVMSQPFFYRSTRIVGVHCYLRQLDRESGEARDWTGYRVAVRYTPSRSFRRVDAADPMVARLVINESVFPPAPPGPALEAATPMRSVAKVDSGFSLSPNWLKIEVDRRGMYVITGEDFPSSVPLASINDPSSFRLFTGGGAEQHRLFAVPGGSWEVGNWMRETAILVDYGGDATFNPQDKIIFYGLGADDWKDYYDPSAPDSEYYTHYRAQKNYYYLTWDSSFPGSPRRMAVRDAAPAPVADRKTYRQRYYAEKNILRKFDFRGDGWLWAEILKSGRDNAQLDIVDVNDLVKAVPQEFRTIALAPYDDESNHHRAVYKVRSGGTTREIGEYEWEPSRQERYYQHGKPVYLTGHFLAEGSNNVILEVPRDPNPTDWMYFAWYALAYERALKARDDALDFTTPDTSATVNFLCNGFSTDERMYAFDVTDQFDVAELENVEETVQGGSRRVRLSTTIAGQRRHLWVTTASGFESPASIRNRPQRDLRAVSKGPNMVIVTHRAFEIAGRAMRAHRMSNLPYYSSPVVELVTTEDIYDNFSGGQPDAMAIRNYIKFLYDNFRDGNGNPLLAFVQLLGDATVDFKYYSSSKQDHVPTNLNMDSAARGAEAYATDEWFSHLDASDQPDTNLVMLKGWGLGDVAIGRLPAGSASEAMFLVNRVIGYEKASPLENWRQKVILVADDARKYCFETRFTDQSEWIVTRLPSYINTQKIYLAAYDDISGFKPEARFDLLEMWNDGAIAINYIGHGSAQQMADEQVFLAQDVGLLKNGNRMPIVMAFSCTVGDFANSTEQSLSEKLLFQPKGGAIGTVMASNLTLVDANAYLMYAIFDEMVPDAPGEGVPMGEAMMLAKNAVIEPRLGIPGIETLEDNNFRYNLMCDPAMRVWIPRYDVRLESSGADTLVAGLRKTIRAGVYENGRLKTDFSGTVDITFREPDLFPYFQNELGCWHSYRYPGGTIYKGTADVTRGEFEVSFRVPRYARTGKLAYLTAYATNGVTDAGTSVDSVFALVSPTPADSTELQPVDGRPRVLLGFKSGLKTVKPGESLQAIVRDGDGINILSTTNEGRQSLMIDDAPVPIDVTEFFKFDHGGTDTSGVLVYPLPNLRIGDHRAIYKVSDSFGRTSLDTLSFAVTDSMDFYVEAVLNYPNPFSTTTHFMLTLSDRASVRLDIYTVSGKRVRRLEATLDGGLQWVFWDGRDTVGDEIANGTYLYVATVDFKDTGRPPLVLRGKLSKIE